MGIFQNICSNTQWSLTENLIIFCFFGAITYQLKRVIVSSGLMSTGICKPVEYLEITCLIAFSRLQTGLGAYNYWFNIQKL